MDFFDDSNAQGRDLATMNSGPFDTLESGPTAQPPAVPSVVAGGWDPFDVWRTRVRDPRRALRGRRAR